MHAFKREGTTTDEALIKKSTELKPRLLPPPISSHLYVLLILGSPISSHLSVLPILGSVLLFPVPCFSSQSTLLIPLNCIQISPLLLFPIYIVNSSQLYPNYLSDYCCELSVASGVEH